MIQKSTFQNKVFQEKKIFLEIIIMTSKQKKFQNQQVKKHQTQENSFKVSQKVTSYQSSHNNRLGGLIHHPSLIQQHKTMIQNKMQKVNFTRKLVQFSGIGIFALHMVNNRFRLSRSTGLFIAIPPTISYVVKILGYFWVDDYAQRSGLYRIYRISTF